MTHLPGSTLIATTLALFFALALPPPQPLHAQLRCDPSSGLQCNSSLQSGGGFWMPGSGGGSPNSVAPGQREDGSELEVFAMNIAIGAVTSAVAATIRGRPIRRAATLGAVGGAINYVGKELVVQRFDGAGFLGRQVSAVGASLTRDAVEGTPAFRRMVFPLGVLHLHVNADAPRPVTVKADLPAMIATGIAISRGDNFDMKRSLSAGTPIFTVDFRDTRWVGEHMAGVVRLAEYEGILMNRDALRHEMVHVVQNDGGFITWSEPVERRLAPLVPGLRWLHRFTDFGLQVPVKTYLNSRLHYDKRPWEWEAGVLSQTWATQRGS